MKIALFQYDMKWENKEFNKSKILNILEKQRKDFDYIIFPEMTLTGFSMNESKTTLNNEDLDFFKNIAIKYNSYVSFGGVLNKENVAITLNKESNIVNQYSKIHLFSKGGEDKNYKSGKSETIFNIDNVNSALRICYDLRFSYLFWDLASKVNLYIVIASWPASRREHWLNLLKARAIENQAYVIGVNRIGSDPVVKYSGDSVVFNSFGEELLNLKNEEGVKVVDIDFNELLDMRNKFNFIKDRLR